ncbi:uncharacterized protein LOC126919349 [Bombus affinis]|uniref:uncharacterized protein LOC126919349 n=1 Tax=Bombus affinis TaxID=309941 RepID=UPI0021B7F850|nr:uncharacterized protein LOC126919349 [Bombus affinis]
MATARTENVSNIDYELLALFDDPVALSQLENILLNSELYNMYDIDQIEIVPSIENNVEIRKDNECQDNGTNIIPNEEAKKHVFAVPTVYNCMYCERRFYNQAVLRKHQLNHTKDLLRCIHCGFRSHSFGFLRRHHTYYHHTHCSQYVRRMPMKE